MRVKGHTVQPALLLSPPVPFPSANGKNSRLAVHKEKGIIQRSIFSINDMQKLL